MDKNTQQPAQEAPTIIVIFGITGDLAKRYVLPALYHLLKDGFLPEGSHIIGTTRSDMTENNLLDGLELCKLDDHKACDPAVLEEFKSIFEIIKFDPIKLSSYEDLKAKLATYEEKKGVCCNRLFYLSIPPQVFGPIVRLLGESGLSGSCEHNNAQSRLLVEKPFGYDLKSAKDLIAETGEYFKEDQIFRIDHYLAKEMAQNILTLRKLNPLFNATWNNKLISKISIRALESLDIEGRANFYDNVGALRDLIQSHLLQLLAITTMELPDDITNSQQIHAAKLELFNAIVPPDVNNLSASAIRGQYDGYKEEAGKPDSTTETYVKLRLNIDNPQWSGVNIILETGKALKGKQTDISIDFSDPNDPHAGSNQLTMRLQPNEGIDLKLKVKTPGFYNIAQEATMDFDYLARFDDHGHPDAYERVLTDAIKGDQALFASSQEVIRSWQILEPVLNGWQKSSDDLIIYKKGSSGPKTTEEFAKLINKKP